MTKLHRLSTPPGVFLIVAAPVLLCACSTQQMMNVALSKDPKAAFKSMEQSKLETYKRNPQVLIADFGRVNAELARLFGNLKQGIPDGSGKQY